MFHLVGCCARTLREIAARCRERPRGRLRSLLDAVLQRCQGPTQHERPEHQVGFVGRVVIEVHADRAARGADHGASAVASSLDGDLDQVIGCAPRRVADGVGRGDDQAEAGEVGRCSEQCVAQWPIGGGTDDHDNELRRVLECQQMTDACDQSAGIDCVPGARARPHRPCGGSRRVPMMQPR